MDEERENREELTEDVIGALFADELEPVRVAVPGHPESWVELLPMDAAAMTKYQSLAASLAQSAGQPRKGAAPTPLDLTPAVEFLLCETLVDWRLVGKTRTLTPPEPGRGDPDRARKDAIKAMRRGGKAGITARLQNWLEEQCMRVNHLTEADQGRRDEDGKEIEPGN